MERKVIIWVKDKVIRKNLCWLKHTFLTVVKLNYNSLLFLFVLLFSFFLRKSFLSFSSFEALRRSLCWVFAASTQPKVHRHTDRTVTESLENEIAGSHHIM